MNSKAEPHKCNEKLAADTHLLFYKKAAQTKMVQAASK